MAGSNSDPGSLAWLDLDEFDETPVTTELRDPTEAEPLPPAGASASVLVVDDQPEIRQLVSLWVETDERLELAGTAADGREASTKRNCYDRTRSYAMWRCCW